MTHLRFNSNNCMPAGSYYPATNPLNWFLNNFEASHGERSVPLANIVETKNDFRIELAVPGFSKEDFNIKLEGQILTISGEKNGDAVKEDESFVRHEFTTRSFSRGFRLTNWVDSGNINAKVENGILQVLIPKVEEAKSKPAKDIRID